jgi:hypothetical protein
MTISVNGDTVRRVDLYFPCIRDTRAAIMTTVDRLRRAKLGPPIGQQPGEDSRDFE